MDENIKNNFSDKALLAEIKERFHMKDKALNDLKIVHDKLNGAHNKLVEVDQLKSRFLSIVQNEVRNPLGSIIGLAELIVNRDISDCDKCSDLVITILKEAYYLLFQMDNILEASLLESGEETWSCKDTNLKDIISLSISKQIFEYENLNLKITTDFQSDSAAYCDSEKVKIIINNLINNAIKFNKQNGEIIISIYKEENNIIMSVKDTGEGIDKQDSTKIFERFRQVDMRINRKYQGCGLGLSVSKGLAELQNGKIWFDSILNEGSTFYLSLPIPQNADLDNNEFEDLDDDDDIEFF